MKEPTLPENSIGKKEIILLPGPVSLSHGVREALMEDCSPWSKEFIDICATIAADLKKIAGVSPACEQDYVVVFNQGCGSFMIEALCNTLIPKQQSKLLVLKNGIYGERVYDCARRVGLNVVCCESPLEQQVSLADLEKHLIEDPSITHVWAIHCETSSGILNPIAAMADLVKSYGKQWIIDSVASFGCEPQKIEEWGADAIFATSNKCMEGAPGFSFACIKKQVLESMEGNACSFAMDLYGQHHKYQQSGMWRYTPPTHIVLAFARALKEFWQEGGQEQRKKRYSASMDTLICGMKELGFQLLIDEQYQSSIIATFLQPDSPFFDRPTFNRLLKEGGFEIYPSWQTGTLPTIRIATIGALVHAEVIEDFLSVVKQALLKMGVLKEDDFNNQQA